MRGFDFDKALVALQNELHCFAYKRLSCNSWGINIC